MENLILSIEATVETLQHDTPDCRNATAVTDLLQFNFSKYDYPGADGNGPFAQPLNVISGLKITFCIINMIISILGNTAVIIAVYHNPALRSTINFYLVCLCDKGHLS